MGYLKRFEIRFSTLKPGLNDFRFELEDAFFKEFENSEVEQGAGECLLMLDKKPNLLRLDFSIRLTIQLICDRSLKRFSHPVEIHEQLIVKFGDEESELGEDIIMISWDRLNLNVAQYIYEYISVAVPMKKIHPDHLTENESEFGVIIYKSENDSSEKVIDPRWEALRKLN